MSSAVKLRSWWAILLQQRRRRRLAVPSVPNAPENLAVADDGVYIYLTWDDRSNDESAFRVYRKIEEDHPPFELYDAVGPGVTSYQDGGLVTGTTYSYCVVAFNDVGESATSNIVTHTFNAS